MATNAAVPLSPGWTLPRAGRRRAANPELHSRGQWWKQLLDTAKEKKPPKILWDRFLFSPRLWLKSVSEHEEPQRGSQRFQAPGAEAAWRICGP